MIQSPDVSEAQKEARLSEGTECSQAAMPGTGKTSRLRMWWAHLFSLGMAGLIGAVILTETDGDAYSLVCQWLFFFGFLIGGLFPLLPPKLSFMWFPLVVAAMGFFYLAEGEFVFEYRRRWQGPGVVRYALNDDPVGFYIAVSLVFLVSVIVIWLIFRKRSKPDN